MSTIKNDVHARPQIQAIRLSSIDRTIIVGMKQHNGLEIFSGVPIMTGQLGLNLIVHQHVDNNGQRDPLSGLLHNSGHHEHETDPVYVVFHPFKVPFFRPSPLRSD